MIALHFLFYAILIALLAYFFTRAFIPKQFRSHADHYHWIIRSVAALLAVAALIATAIGTWRGSGKVPDAMPSKITIPTRTPRPIQGYEIIDLGSAKLIVTVIVALRQDDHFIPVSGESRVCNWTSGARAGFNFSGHWQTTSYSVNVPLNRFFNPDGATLRSEGGVYVETRGPAGSTNSGGGSIPLESLKMVDIGSGLESLQRSPFSLVPYDDGGGVCLLVHLARADVDDPLSETSAAQWLAGQSTAHLGYPLNASYRGTRHDPYAPPGFRMFAYVGPSAFLLLLAAAVGSMCFRHRWRGPAFAGLINCMVIYAGALDALVLQRRASVMMDSSQAESNRVLAMSAMPGTFFHAKRAAFLIDEAAREGKIPPAMRTSER